MESVDLRKSSSQAKCLGAIVSVAGAFVVTLYKGPAIIFLKPSSNSDNYNYNNELLYSQKPEWILGGLLMLIVCLLSATWNVAQVYTNLMSFTLYYHIYSLLR